MPKSESKQTKRSLSNGKSNSKITQVFPEVGRRIKVYRNGDPYDAGINVVLNMRKIHDIGTFLDVINDRISLVNGAKRLYTTNGQLVRKTSELQNGKEYVASSGQFTPLNYGKRALQREHSMSTLRASAKTSSTTTSRSKSMEPPQRRKKPEKPKAPTVSNGTKPVVNGGSAMQRSKSFVQQKTPKEVPKVTSVPAKKPKQVPNGIPPSLAPKKPPTAVKQEVKKVKKEINGVKPKIVKEKKRLPTPGVVAAPEVHKKEEKHEKEEEDKKEKSEDESEDHKPESRESKREQHSRESKRPESGHHSESEESEKSEHSAASDRSKKSVRSQSKESNPSKTSSRHSSPRSSKSRTASESSEPASEESRNSSPDRPSSKQSKHSN